MLSWLEGSWIVDFVENGYWRSPEDLQIIEKGRLAEERKRDDGGMWMTENTGEPTCLSGKIDNLEAVIQAA